MNLYRLITDLGVFWVIAETPAEAEKKLNLALDDAAYPRNGRSVEVSELRGKQLSANNPKGDLVL